MPHKDRARYIAYLAAHRAKNRPSPRLEPQADAELPPYGAIRFSADGETVQCHVCGRWLRALNMHHKLHGLDGDSYRETYGLARTTSLWPPALQEKQRQAALDRDQGAVGRANIPAGVTRPKGLAARLSTKVEASATRKGINLRAGKKSEAARR